MSKYTDALKRLETNSSVDKLYDHELLKEIIAFGEQYIGLNRIWNEHTKSEGRYNLTTKELERIFEKEKSQNSYCSEAFKYKKDIDRIVIEELRAKIGYVINEPFIENMIFNLAVDKTNFGGER